MMKLLSKIKSLFQKAEGDFGKKEKTKIKPGMNGGSKKDIGKEVFQKTGKIHTAGQSSTYVPDEVQIGPEGRKPLKKRTNVVNQSEEDVKKPKSKSIKKRVNAIKSVKVDLSGKRSPVKKTTSKPSFKKKTPKY